MDDNTLVLRRQIFNALSMSLQYIPKTLVERSNPAVTQIVVMNDNESFPDFELQWCSQKKHYRVYILIASRTKCKSNPGYAIMTIKSPMVASIFATIYKLLYSNRANNREGNES